MFDKLIESNSEEAEFKNRRNYFVVSTIVVGVLFLAAVVASIYAGNIGIGYADLEASDLLAPIETAAIEPEHPEPQRQSPNENRTSDTPRREVNMLRPDESPSSVPPISTVPNSHLSRPLGSFDFGPDSNPASTSGTGRNPSTGPGESPGLALPALSSENQKPESDPPPSIKAHPAPMQSLGVVNGKASSLPKPAYPPPALALNIQGKVDVQVTIDEAGKVISARAVSGHPLLRAAAEKAAWSARFTPTLLSTVPVKVTGVIVYNFTKN